MKSIKRILLLILAVALLGWAFLFALANDTVLPLDLVWASLPAHHVSWWLLAAFAVGLVAGWLLATISGWLRGVRRRKAAA